MFFGRKSGKRVLVFVTTRQEIFTMAQAILHDLEIPFATHEAGLGLSAGELPSFAINVFTRHMEAARKGLSRLVELDASMCGG